MNRFIKFKRTIHIKAGFILSPFLACFLISFQCCSLSERKEPFLFKEDIGGVELYEDEKPVFYYQKEAKLLDGQYLCNNYLHPLYFPGGDTLTEESPADHPYHRGIYWAWHQIYIGEKNIADGWIMQHISYDITGLQINKTKSAARLSADVSWKSSEWQNGNPFVSEHTIITVHRCKKGIRLIDFEIRLRAIVPGVSIGGSDDEKGYGGFCARIKLPDDIEFTSERGPVVPQTLQIEAGSWMDFSGSFGVKGKKSGLTIICDPLTPNYPAPWILRRESSMQNVVYPGRKRVTLPTDEDLVLRYRLVMHNGEAQDIDFDKLVDGK